MKRILLTGGGTGGHIYPLLAVADHLVSMTSDTIELIYFGPAHKLNQEFIRRGITVYTLASSKIRRYASLENIFDIPRFFISLVQAWWRMFFLMPDIVFSKGGPGAFSVVFAAWFYMIPVIIHESDAVPGLTNRISSRCARRIAISFTKAAGFFPPRKTALVGNPIRASLLNDVPEQGSAKESLEFKKDEPLILILGGSQGSERINTFVLDNLSVLLEMAQVYHQTGLNNFSEIQSLSKIILKDVPEPLRGRYHFSAYFNEAQMKVALAAADIVVSRAGSGAIYEIAAFGKPSVLIPLDGAANDHQRANAYAFADCGAAEVIEESNFTPNIVLVQIKNILEDTDKRQMMVDAARHFAKPAAAKLIGDEILKLVKYKSPFSFRK